MTNITRKVEVTFLLKRTIYIKINCVLYSKFTINSDKLYVCPASQQDMQYVFNSTPRGGKILNVFISY